MRLVLLGDSFTAGYGVDPAKCWANRIMMPDWDTINQGLNGDTTYGMEMRFFEDVVDYLPDRVLITGGINDLVVGASVDDIVASYASMVMTAREFAIEPVIGLQPSIEPSLASLYWISGIDYYRVAGEQYRLTKALRELAKENEIAKLDFYHRMERIKARRPTKTFYTDGMHLIAEAHEYMADFAQEKLIAMPLRR